MHTRIPAPTTLDQRDALASMCWAPTRPTRCPHLYLRQSGPLGDAKQHPRDFVGLQNMFERPNSMATGDSTTTVVIGFQHCVVYDPLWHRIRWKGLFWTPCSAATACSIRFVFARTLLADVQALKKRSPYFLLPVSTIFHPVARCF
jgi:hypothetical protein